ncbi:hypothetical protein [Corynebacterium sp. HMSC28B08]|uniref:hypothetical protein n=1 Tax=Corynebacterium TaxID=1716 RepID=UPI0008A1B994|nr:hypothetical protein [Corynebacterium sp. HMSC28B08]OFT89248.1 hypothetical protein HMPREF3098_05820 [Corynebacterium sp. HMSC28B08]
MDVTEKEAMNQLKDNHWTKIESSSLNGESRRITLKLANEPGFIFMASAPMQLLSESTAIELANTLVDLVEGMDGR